jgi:hypothetical protein
LTVAILIFAAALVLLAAALVLSARPPRTGAVLSGRTVTVNTRRPDDQSIRGVLVAHHSDRLTLADAVYVVAGEAPDIEISGTVHVLTANVAFLQEH